MDVALRITRIPTGADAARKRLPFATIDSGDIVVSHVKRHLTSTWFGSGGY